MDELGDRLARGEQAAFAELYDACAQGLHRYLMTRLRSPADADDVMQETFVRLARARHKLADVRSLTAYVFTVARHEAARLVHHRAREYARRSKLEPADLAVAASDDAGEALAAALVHLSPDHREVVELKIYAELSLREIADVLRLPPGTVATRYRAAIGRLRELVARNHHE